MCCYEDSCDDRSTPPRVRHADVSLDDEIEAIRTAVRAVEYPDDGILRTIAQLAELEAGLAHWRNLPYAAVEAYNRAVRRAGISSPPASYSPQGGAAIGGYPVRYELVSASTGEA